MSMKSYSPARFADIANPEIASADESEIVEIEVKGYRRKIIRKKRRKGCHCDNGQPAILTAKGPGTTLAPQSLWSEHLGGTITKQIPLCDTGKSQYCSIGGHLKLSLPVGTLTDGLASLLPLFETLYERIKEQNLSADSMGRR